MFNLENRAIHLVVYISAIAFLLSSIAVAGSLHEAAKDGDYGKVTALIAEGSDINVNDENGLTPLHFAASQGHKDLVGLLLKLGANVNAVDKQGNTPLIWAEQNGHKEVVELLIYNGAKNNLD